MHPRRARLLAVTTATLGFGALGTATAHAETPSFCQGRYVCLENGTAFGAPADAYPETSGDDRITAEQIVRDCAAESEQDISGVACGFYPYAEPRTTGYGTWKPLTADFSNCYGGNEQNNLTWSHSNEYSTSNSVTVGAGVEIGLSELVKASIQTSYQHTWGRSTGSTQSFSAFVPKGHKAHLQHRYQRQEVTGVLWIDYEHTGTGPMEGHGHHYWAITDFTAVSPVKDEDGVVRDQVALSRPQRLQQGDCPD
ncbi:hypothetical protein [Streptomyces nigra]|uniref:hypothetical protein n=1 Tax=Streptomyces nigra TaxID=1827580 RepID=UPI00342B4F3E